MDRHKKHQRRRNTQIRGRGSERDEFSVTRLDYFSKFFATNFIAKVTQIYGDLLGCFENSFFGKTVYFCYFLGNFFGKFGLLQIPTCGHTDNDRQKDYTTNGQSKMIRLTAISNFEQKGSNYIQRQNWKF